MIAINLNTMRITADPDTVGPRKFYSKLKELWYRNPMLTALPFPLHVAERGEHVDPAEHGVRWKTRNMLEQAADVWSIDYDLPVLMPEGEE